MPPDQLGRRWHVQEEQDGAGNTLATFTYGNRVDDLISAQRDTDTGGVPEEYWYHADDQQSVVLITDELGDPVARYEYGDFGAPTFAEASGISSASSTSPNRYLFTGRRYDSEAGLYHYRTRYVDPTAGVFTTRDPIGLWGDTLSLGNGIAYVAGNPSSLTDPFGLEVILESRRVMHTALVGTHTFLRIRANGRETTFGGHALNGAGGDLFIVRDHPTDLMQGEHGLPSRGRVTIEPPEGMNSRQWDRAVFRAGMNAVGRSRRGNRVEFNALGGGELKTGGNCNVFARRILLDAGADGPIVFDPLGIAPGLHRSGEIVSRNWTIGGSVVHICFPFETSILVENGLKPIGLVLAGDRVVVPDAFATSGELARVRSSGIVGVTSQFIEVEVSSEVIRCTASHPFLTSARGWIQARSLRVGDRLLAQSGMEKKILNIERLVLNPAPARGSA